MMSHRARGARAVVIAIAAGSLALTGCSKNEGGKSGKDSKKDQKEAAVQSKAVTYAPLETNMNRNAFLPLTRSLKMTASTVAPAPPVGGVAVAVPFPTRLPAGHAAGPSAIRASVVAVH